MVTVKREVQAVLLILVGGAVMRIALSGAYLNYVKAGQKPFLIASAAVLLLLGVMALVDSLRGSRAGQGAGGMADPSHAHDEELLTGTEHASVGHEAVAVIGDDGHNHGSMKSAWLLLLPVAAIFLIAPPPLGAFSAAREESSVAAPSNSTMFEPLPPGDPVPVALDDYAVRAVWDDGRTLVGRTVTTIGFVTPTGDGQWVLTRLALACCAADAVATKVSPMGEVPNLPANTWVEVTGSWIPGGGTQQDNAVPLLQVKSLAEIPAPADPYL